MVFWKPDLPKLWWPPSSRPRQFFDGDELFVLPLTCRPGPQPLDHLRMEQSPISRLTSAETPRNRFAIITPKDCFLFADSVQ
jgi:hypothetical protein